MKPFRSTLLLLTLLLLASSCIESDSTTPGGDDITNPDSTGTPADSTGNGGGVTAPLDTTAARLAIDTVLGTPGRQGCAQPTGIGPGERVGFAVYARDIAQLRAFSIAITWDAAKADWLGGISGPRIPDESLTINGAAVKLAAEANILGQTAAVGEVNEPGCYANNFAKFGGTAPVVDDYVLVFFCAFKTEAAFSAADSLNVRVALTTGDDAGKMDTLGPAFFTINP